MVTLGAGKASQNLRATRLKTGKLSAPSVRLTCVSCFLTGRNTQTSAIRMATREYATRIHSACSTVSSGPNSAVSQSLK